MYTTRSSQPFTVNMQLKPYLRHPSPANGTPRKKRENFILSLSLSLYIYIIYKHTHTHTQIHLPRTLSLALSRSLARAPFLSLSVSISLSPTSYPLPLPKPALQDITLRYRLAIYRPCPVLSESTPSGGVGRTNSGGWTPSQSPRHHTSISRN